MASTDAANDSAATPATIVFGRVLRILKLHGHFAFDLNGADAGVFPRQQDQDHVAVPPGSEMRGADWRKLSGAMLSAGWRDHRSDGATVWRPEPVRPPARNCNSSEE